jgi:hypothetical protein
MELRPIEKPAKGTDTGWAIEMTPSNNGGFFVIYPFGDAQPGHFTKIVKHGLYANDVEGIRAGDPEAVGRYVGAVEEVGSFVIGGSLAGPIDFILDKTDHFTTYGSFFVQEVAPIDLKGILPEGDMNVLIPSSNEITAESEQAPTLDVSVSSRFL